MTTKIWFYIVCVLVSLHQSRHICKGRISISHSAGVHNTHMQTESGGGEGAGGRVGGGGLLMDQHMYSWMTKQPRDEHKRIHETCRHANTALRVTTHLLTVTVSRMSKTEPMAVCFAADACMQKSTVPLKLYHVSTSLFNPIQWLWCNSACGHYVLVYKPLDPVHTMSPL